VAGFRNVEGLLIKQCASCGGDFEAKRSTRQTCSDLCRVRKSRGVTSGSAEAVSGESDGREGANTRATRLVLVAAKRDESPAGVRALTLAKLLDARGASEPLAAVAALDKQLGAVLAEALDGANVKESPVDRIRRDAAAKLVGLTG